MDVFFDWDDDLLEKYNTIWDKITEFENKLKKNLTENLSIINIF